MSSYENLKALTDTAPAGQTDSELADWCNEPQNEWQQVGQMELLKWCAQHNIIKKLNDEVATPTTVQSQAFSDVLLVLIYGAGLDATDSGIRTLMTKLRSDGVISQAELDDLITLAQKQVTRAQQIGWLGLVTVHDIAHVRTL